MAETDGPGSDDLEGRVTDEIGGVQGGQPDDSAETQVAQSARPGAPPDQPAPDGGELEWAGALVRKPPPTAP